MTTKRSDIITGVSLFAFAGLLFIASGQMPTRENSSMILSTGFYPRLLAILLAVLSIIMVMESIQKNRKQGDRQASPYWKDLHAFLYFLIVIGLLILYPLGMRLMGFDLTSFLFLSTLVWLLTEKEKRKPWVILSVSLGISVIVYVVFKLILEIPFPMGILFS
ncbi:MAG: tripartite tricarboxylate transporter TctB family protein [Spirochaetales bacterium]|jgi:putative tricarboxylic transport membrane protein|nr:tripartite tricarboxylate transporter TctB family protein [Spirochaetales bacterium]